MLNTLSRAALVAALVWAPLASGAGRGWALAVLHVLVAIALAAWLGAMLTAGRLEWRRTALDLPLGLVGALGLVQLALGNASLVRWALAPPPATPALVADFPWPWLAVGAVKPAQTLRSFLLFACYAAVYALVVQQIRTRLQVGRLVRALLLVGTLAAVLGLLDALLGEGWLRGWNGDHYAAWLAALICLGLGWLFGRRRVTRDNPSFADELTRRYLPLLGVATMTVALLLTFSRAAMVSLGAGLAGFVLLLGALGRARRNVVIGGVALVAALTCGAWAGVGPWLERAGLEGDDAPIRFTEAVRSARMLVEFPVFGVGLGGYRDIVHRYLSLADLPRDAPSPSGPSDLLRFVLETGVAGAALAVWLLWRLVTDLVRAHLLGRGACPADGGAGDAARRNDPYSIGVALGALTGTLALLVQSGVQAPLRTPAAGMLAAALLGLATVALHTRLVTGREQLLTAVRVLELRARGALAAGAVGVAGFATLAAWAGFAAWTALALAGDPWDDTALLARARARLEAASAPPAGRAPGAEPGAPALALLAAGRADLRVALGVAPTNPRLHHQLALLEAAAAALTAPTDGAAMAVPLAHAARAVALAPADPRLYASVARLAQTARPELGLTAAREAARLGPELIPELVDLYRAAGLAEAAWLALVPDTAADRLELAAALEARGLTAEGLAAYRAALAAAPQAARPLCRWLLGQALARAGQAPAAQAELEQAVREDRGSPEVHGALADARAGRDDPAALQSYRDALAAAERRAGLRPRPPLFALTDGRLRGIAERRAGPGWERPSRHRRALARYLVEHKLWEPAVPEWERLASDEPKDAEAQFALGMALDGAGRAQEALGPYRRAVALDANALRYRERLAQRLWDGEQFSQAIDEWRIVKGQVPTRLEARLALARAYEGMGDRADALQEYREILELAPAHPAALQAVEKLGARRP
jgi:tetratricopeptide (TPR) repeat protein